MTRIARGVTLARSVEMVAGEQRIELMSKELSNDSHEPREVYEH